MKIFISGVLFVIFAITLTASMNGFDVTKDLSVKTAKYDGPN
jgi:hypothetical protein